MNLAAVWMFQMSVSALACAAIFSSRDTNSWGGALLFRLRAATT